MNKAEAESIAERDLGFYRSLSYEEIAAKIGGVEHFERLSDNGEPYQVEFEFMFDDEQEETIRVWAEISYSLWTDMSPVTSCFIIAPNGRFVGE